MINTNGLGQNRLLVSVLLWGGAGLAIAGLWWPNWVNALLGHATPFYGIYAFRTPVIAYVGYVILWIACILVVGLRGSAGDFKAPGWIGLASVAIVILSAVLAQLRASASLLLFLFVSGSFLATLFIYYTMKKVAGISRFITYFAWGMNFIALILGIITVAMLSRNDVRGLIYIINAAYSLTWLIISLSVLPTHYRDMMAKRRKQAEV